ncbi:hypothetical protein JCM14076_18620 [Methylosoma difficile]
MSNTYFISTLYSGFEATAWLDFALDAALPVFFGLLAVLEISSPFKKSARKRLRQSYQANLGLFAVNGVLMALLSVSSLLVLAQNYSHWGLLSAVDNTHLKIGLSLLLLDALLYAWHFACHHFDSLWLFHKVHHNDAAVNTSTAFRVHVAELLLTTLVKSLAIVLLGIDAMALLLYETVYPFFIIFHHANIKFNAEYWLGWLVIVPALHRTHHAELRHQHDHNYGAVLSVWDRLLGTLLVQEPDAIGLAGDSPQTVWGLLGFGFGFNGPATAIPALDAMIAEAAYYRAEKRNFSPGDELADWLEAKRDILNSAYANNLEQEAWHLPSLWP